MRKSLFPLLLIFLILLIGPARAQMTDGTYTITKLEALSENMSDGENSLLLASAAAVGNMTDSQYTAEINSIYSLSGSACVEFWSCSGWSACSGGVQTRTCTDANGCGTENSKPVTYQSCSLPSPGSSPGGFVQQKVSLSYTGPTDIATNQKAYLTLLVKNNENKLQENVSIRVNSCPEGWVCGQETDVGSLEPNGNATARALMEVGNVSGRKDLVLVISGNGFSYNKLIQFNVLDGCTLNSHCIGGQVCVGFSCSEVFDLAIVRLDNPVALGETLDFTYLVKEMIGLEGDVEMQYWLERNGIRYAEGSEVVYVSGREEKTFDSFIYISNSVPTGDYSLNVLLGRGDYGIRAQKPLEIVGESYLVMDSEIRVYPDTGTYAGSVNTNKDGDVMAEIRLSISDASGNVQWEESRNVMITKTYKVEGTLPMLNPGQYVMELKITKDDKEAISSVRFNYLGLWLAPWLIIVAIAAAGLGVIYKIRPSRKVVREIIREKPVIKYLTRTKKGPGMPEWEKMEREPKTDDSQVRGMKEKFTSMMRGNMELPRDAKTEKETQTIEGDMRKLKAEKEKAFSRLENVPEGRDDVTRELTKLYDIVTKPRAAKPDESMDRSVIGLKQKLIEKEKADRKAFDGFLGRKAGDNGEMMNTMKDLGNAVFEEVRDLRKHEYHEAELENAVEKFRDEAGRKILEGEKVLEDVKNKRFTEDRKKIKEMSREISSTVFEGMRELGKVKYLHLPTEDALTDYSHRIKEAKKREHERLERMRKRVEKLSRLDEEDMKKSGLTKKGLEDKTSKE